MSIPETSKAARSDMPPPPLPMSRSSTDRAPNSTIASQRPNTASGVVSENYPSTPSVPSRKAVRLRSATGGGSPRMDNTAHRPRLGSWAFQYTPPGGADQRHQGTVAKRVGAQTSASNSARDTTRRPSETEGEKKSDYNTKAGTTQVTPSQSRNRPVTSGASTKDLALDVPSYSINMVPSSSDAIDHMMPSSIGLSQPPSATKPQGTPIHLPDSVLPSASFEARAYVVSTDTDPLLRVVAAQERRVLELKEDLKNEEEKLAKLKLQWANQEARKKRSESRRSEQMRPLTSPTFKASEAERCSQDGAGSEGSADTAKPQRTKFEGGRHLRTLTLTSPTAGGVTPDPSPQQEATVDEPPQSSKERSRTSPINVADPRQSVPASLMGDLRENLWTFIEDLKQATVGEEATVSPEKQRPGQERASPRLPPRTQTPDKRASMPPLRPRPGLASATFRPPPQPARIPSPAAAEDEDDADGWDNWDSPPPSAAKESSPASAVGSSESEAAWSSPRTSTR